MVLRRALVALAVIAIAGFAAGCGQSLFDSHGGGRDGGGGDDGGGDDAAVPSECPEPCIADAAADFDGSPGGAGNHWRYLDDQRDRKWSAMSDGGTVFDGGDQMDRISSCKNEPSALACAGLRDALLVTSKGSMPRDPAIEYKAPTARVIQLSFHAHVPSGDGAQKVRLYRNSREDVLFTGVVGPGETLRQTFPAVDALPNDRFLVALEPASSAGGQVALHFFINGTAYSFPTTCLLALPFEGALPMNQIDDLCDGKNFTSMQFGMPPVDVPASLGSGPFTEQGSAADIAPNHYYSSGFSDIVPDRGDVTVQLWAQNDNPNTNAYLYSNIDFDAGGGLTLTLSGTAQRLDILSTKRDAANTHFNDNIAYPSDGAWHFIRVVHANGMLFTCIDGVRRSSLAVPAGNLFRSDYPVFLGRDVEWTMTPGPTFDGRLDDVRVISGALPCEPTN